MHLQMPGITGSEGWLGRSPGWIQGAPFLITFIWDHSCLSTSKLASIPGGRAGVQNSGIHDHYPFLKCLKIRGLCWAVKLIVGIHSLAYLIKIDPSLAAIGAQVPVFQNYLGDKKVMRYCSLFISLLIYLFDATGAHSLLKRTGYMSSVWTIEYIFIYRIYIRIYMCIYIHIYIYEYILGVCLQVPANTGAVLSTAPS